MIELSPLARMRVWKVTLRMISETVGIGTRTESAMNPIAPISGITCSSVAAAFVEVRMMLLSALRLRRRSDAPAAGTASRTLWVFVTAWTVLIEAVITLSAPKRSRSGLIMWASAVVVHDAADTRLWRRGSKAKWLTPWMRVTASSGSDRPFARTLKAAL